MKVLVTGAFGNIGQYVVKELQHKDHFVRCLDLDTKGNRKKAKTFKGNLEFFWGNIRSREIMEMAMEGMDAVIHLAFIIPPKSEKNIEQSWLTNVDGTRCVLETIQKQPRKPVLVFTSSISVYGRTQHMTPPRTIEDPLCPIESYAKQKVLLEEEIRTSGIPNVILRLGAAPPIKYDWVDPILFEIPLSDRMEYIAPEDAGLAISNAVQCKEAIGKILLIGGGKKNQITMREFLQGSLGAVGIGMLPDTAFGSVPYHCDWMDTTESQELFRYQRISWTDYIKKAYKQLAIKRFFVSILQPIARIWLLNQSPYYRDRFMGSLREKTALVTGASSGIGSAISKFLAKKGLTVILSARRNEKLDELVSAIRHDGGKAFAIPADLSKTEDREKLVRESIQKTGKIDFLVNNAGFGWYGYSEKMPWDLAKNMIKVNLESVIHLTSMILPTMIQRCEGFIINIGSIAGDMPNQGIALYGATKAFLSSYSSALFRELKGKNVHISIIKPGAIATDFFRSAKKLTNALPVPAERFGLKPERVAKMVWSLIQRPRKQAYVPGYLSIMPSIEYFFGWIIDILGPLLLKRSQI